MIEFDNEEAVWSEKYRPTRVDDVILPQNIKDIFKGFVNTKTIPNLILTGTPGIGKTTIAFAMLEELGIDYYFINGSLDRNIDTLRNEIQTFASTKSIFKGSRKFVFIDEADNLNPTSVQPALRGFIQDFSKNCGFIFTCNYLNKIIQPLHSRFTIIDFNITKKDSAKVASSFFGRVCEILENEKVEYSKEVIAEIINKYYPDWRRTINQIQAFAAKGPIDTRVLSNFGAVKYHELIDFMKVKNFTEVRKWISENANNDYVSLFSEFYNNSSKYFKPNSIPFIVLTLSKYQYQAAFAANQEINMAACFVELMSEDVFK